LYYRELSGALESANLVPDVVYGAFPSADSLSVLIGSDTVDDPAIASTAAALTARMEQSHFSKQPSLVDAYDMSLRLFESGLTMEFAPLWIVVAPTPPKPPAPGPAAHGCRRYGCRRPRLTARADGQ